MSLQHRRGWVRLRSEETPDRRGSVKLRSEGSHLKRHECPGKGILHTSCCTRHAAHVMLHTSCCTRHAVHVMLHTSCCTRHTAHVMLHTSCCTRHAAHVMLHTSCCTRHAAHVVLYTSCCTRHAAHVMLYVQPRNAVSCGFDLPHDGCLRCLVMRPLDVHHRKHRSCWRRREGPKCHTKNHTALEQK